MMSGGHVGSNSIVQLDCKVSRGRFDAFNVVFCSTSSLGEDTAINCVINAVRMGKQLKVSQRRASTVLLSV
jgi:hypothetical protein